MRKLIYSILFIISIFGVVLQAQTTCDNFTVNTVVTPSTCQSNGTVTVTLSGADAAGLFNVQYSLESAVSGGFSLLPTANNVLSGIPAGTYTVTVSAFCDSQGQYSVAKTKTNVVVGGNYQVPELSFVAPGRSSTASTVSPTSRKSYAGCASGLIVMLLKNGNQTATPVFTMTSAPAGVTVPQIVSVSRYSSGSPSTGYIYTLDGLYPSGDYTVEINDGCYISSKSFTLEELTDIPNPNGTSTTMNQQDVYPYFGDNSNCASINLSLTAPTTSNVDFYQYYRDGLYEIGAAPLDQTPTNWTTWTYNTTPVINLGPNQISDFYNSPNKMSVYFRVKNCPAMQEKYDIYIKKPTTLYTSGYRYYCDNVRVSNMPWYDYDGNFCYPITYRAVRKDNNQVVNEQTNITRYNQVDSLTFEYNTTYTVSVIDNAGTTLSIDLSYSRPAISTFPTSDRKYCDTWENFYYRRDLYCYPVYVDIQTGGVTVALDTI